MTILIFIPSTKIIQPESNLTPEISLKLGYEEQCQCIRQEQHPLQQITFLELLPFQDQKVFHHLLKEW